MLTVTAAPLKDDHRGMSERPTKLPAYEWMAFHKGALATSAIV
jgi:hypothetical protein